MKPILHFFKTVLASGFLVLLPLMLFALLLGEVFQLLIALATPIADLFPKGMFEPIETPVLLAIVLMLFVSFLLGLAVRVTVLSRLGGWLEKQTLARIPIYHAVKRLSLGLLGAKETRAFKPAVLISGNGEREIVYVIEDHQDGEATVLVPLAPAAFAGSVKIVQHSRLEILDASLDRTSRAISLWGVGIKELLGKNDKTQVP
jgi:uncharacterized membrane protein